MGSKETLTGKTSEKVLIPKKGDLLLYTRLVFRWMPGAAGSGCSCEDQVKTEAEDAEETEQGTARVLKD